MILRSPLRAKLLVLTLTPILAVVVGMLWILSRALTQQTEASARDDLRRASAVLENMLDSRAHELAKESQVIAQDPKFFAVLTIPGGAADATLRETMSGVARDFNAVVAHDVFAVVDDRGLLVASVGRATLGPVNLRAACEPALSGRPTSLTVLERGAHYQLAASPVVAGGRALGALVLGARVGSDLAQRLQTFTRSEVSFFAKSEPTATTVQGGAELAELSRFAATRAAEWNRPAAVGALVEIDAEHDVLLTLIRPLPATAASDGHLYALQRSLNAEFAGLRRARSEMLELGLAVLAAALLVGLLVSGHFVAPIQRLVRAAAAMEKGDYDAPLEISRRDELGYLAGRFDDMRQRHRRYVTSLEEVTRLKSEFISVASHELRTPISIIQGFHELMSNGVLGEVNAEQREALDGIGHSTRGLLKIAENATRMAQIHGARLRVDTHENSIPGLIEHAVSAARAAGRDRQIEISFQPSPDCESGYFDGSQLAEAIIQLVSNAIRFTPDGGRVDVRAWRESDDLLIAVRDTGIGIEPDRHATIFERSITVYDAAKHHSSSELEFGSAGLGLGLSIARGIVEAHEGRLTLASEPGRGSTFTIRIPAFGDPARSRAA